MLISHILRIANGYVGQSTEAIIDSKKTTNKQQLDPTFNRDIKTKDMRTIVTLSTPTEARKNSYFSNFKNSKRVQWTAHRHYR